MKSTDDQDRPESDTERLTRVVLDHNWITAKDWADAVLELGNLSDRQIDQLQQPLPDSEGRKT
jgi:hypothetical protein